MATETAKTETTKSETATGGDAKTPVDQIKTPLLAALGAGNLASQAVNDALTKAKERYSDGGDVVRKSVEDARKGFEDAKKNLEELPSELEGLRDKLDPAELRKLLDEYTDAALKLYHRLAESGEEAWDKLLAQPQVKKATDQLGETFQTVQVRVDGATTDVRKGIDDVVSKVTSTVRGVGDDAGEVVEATAEKVSDVAEKAEGAAEKAEDAVEEAATPANSKAATKSSTTKSTTTRRTTSAPKKSTSTTSSKTDK
ncbi:hypothetical protein GCM10009676_43330 [Prauserella halophila]|uniref:Heparin binding hemagglutinin HbhA n=1 Tax=Prauserella halophila TaxID=185641 RepID=A0ABP4H686_9PSEU|nr:hypothetical protein [Prauserella halophila]MCP2237797.1 heparin binding hemagglutinin HbhA [Prauserella halophila]